MFLQVYRTRSFSLRTSSPGQTRKFFCSGLSPDKAPSKLISPNQPSKPEYDQQPSKTERDHQRQYYLKNRDFLLEKARQYRIKNREIILEKGRKYRQENREILRGKYSEKKKEYRRENRDAILKKNREYYIRNKVDLLEKHKQRSKLRSLEERKRRNLPPLNNWKESAKVKQFFEEVAERLGVKKQEDWYRISGALLRTVGGGGLLSRFGTIYYALKFAYPEVNWNEAKFAYRRKATTQWWLYNKVRDLLPGVEILEDHLHQNLFWGHGKRRIELDIWIPHYSLALEYQGEQHFIDNPRAFGGSTVELYNELDSEKRRLCEAQGITLVEIPYWWDRKIESLASTLSHIRPDIFPAVDSFPIPSDPPEVISHTSHNSSSILMHGTNWTKSIHDPTGWWMSEKLDGIRAYWDGTRLLTRWGQSINAPLEFVVALPVGIALDGELWCGYQALGKITGILNRSLKQNNSTGLWKPVTFCVFDAPLAKGSYLMRHEFLKTVISETSSVRIIPIERCEGVTHLEQSLSHIETKKGEGIMLYDPEAPYLPGRTSNLLKAKIYFSDHVEFMRRSDNSIAFICRQKDGTECLVRCDRGAYGDPPPVGHVLMVRHSGTSESSKKFIRAFLPRDTLIDEGEPVETAKQIEDRTLKEELF